MLGSRADLLKDRTRWFGRPLATLLALCFVGYFCYQGQRVATLPAEKIASWNVVIDDGFYYLQVARNMARGHGSTFDRINPTNGYQPLWAWCLVPIFWFTDDPAQGLRAALFFATALSAGGILMLFVALRRLTGAAAALLTTALLCFNPYFVQLLLGGLETPALFFCLGLLALFWARRGRSILGGNPAHAWGLGWLMGLAVLARVDVALVLMPLGLMVFCWTGGWRLRFRRTLRIALGAAMVITPYIVWNLAAHGQLVPVSGRVKQWVVNTYQNSQTLFVHTEQWRGLARTFDLLSFPHEYHKGQFIEDIQPGVLIVAGLCLLIVLRAAFRRRPTDRANPSDVLLLGAGLGVAAHTGYLYFVYRSCSHWNYHYFFPLALLHTVAIATFAPLMVKDLGRLLDWALGRFAVVAHARTLLALLLVLPLCWRMYDEGKTQANAHYASVNRPTTLTFRKARYEMARRMARDYPPNTVFGAWWAGNLGYFSDQRVVNLDGVINSNDFLERYLKRDDVHGYILGGPIRYLVDYFFRDPLAKTLHPHWRAFWWEYEKEHVVKRIQPQLRRRQFLPFRGGAGMYLLEVERTKPAKATPPAPG